jgi:phosphate uptake regulator
MYINDGVAENLKFLIIEVHKQLERTICYIRDPALENLNLILSRHDYIETLKTTIQRKCFSAAAGNGGSAANSVDALKSLDIVAVNLASISDFCEKIVRQLTYIEDEDILAEYDFEGLFDLVLQGVAGIEDAVIELDVNGALGLCQIERDIDAMYASLFKGILDELTEGKRAQSLVTILFIARYLERMGDSLLAIGEAVISTFLGEHIRIDQLDALDDSLRASHLDATMLDVSLENVGESKSGCRIDLVSSREDNGAATLMIFKQGRREKLAEEKAGVDTWEALAPGIAPNIYAHRQIGDSGALLFEYLDGRTFEQIVLDGTRADLDSALSKLCETVSGVWRRTRQERTCRTNFIGQIRARMSDVYEVHPAFATHDLLLFGIPVSSFERLMDEVAEIELSLPPGDGVLTHGDFNTDNIIFEPRAKTVRFIDLHRSSINDYVQDVSVFLVSNFRLKVLDAATRRRVNEAINGFYDFARGYAEDTGDHHFEIRLALGLARSFATSTRFFLDESLPREMLLRSRYLLEFVAAQGGVRPHKFKLPNEVLHA